jgi:hypothetical protein
MTSWRRTRGEMNEIQVWTRYGITNFNTVLLSETSNVPWNIGNLETWKLQTLVIARASWDLRTPWRVSQGYILDEVKKWRKKGIWVPQNWAMGLIFRRERKGLNSSIPGQFTFSLSSSMEYPLRSTTITIVPGSKSNFPYCNTYPKHPNIYLESPSVYVWCPQVIF